jgi:glycosyltransferase involved in cell wall biosynthesis
MPSQRPKVFVVTPSLNQGRFISETIASVLNQDYPNLDYFVADGGSTDETLDVLASLSARVRWRSAPDPGQASAINDAFYSTDAEYVGWLNSDDLYLPGAISAMVASLEARPRAPFVYGHADNVDATGANLGRARQVEAFDPNRLINAVDFIAQPATLIRRVAFVEAGGFDTTFTWTFDYDLWTRLTDPPPVFLDGVLAVIRVHGAAKTSTGGLSRLMEIERMAQKHGRTSIPDGFAARMAFARAEAAWSALRNKDLGESLRHAFVGLKHASAYLRYRISQFPNLSHFKSATRGETR